MSLSIFLLLIIILQNINVDASSYSNLKIYKSLNAAHHCFRRMNQTHQIGCSSSPHNSFGVAVLLRDDHDLDLVQRSGQDAPYTILISAEKFMNRTIVHNLRNAGSNRISGILILDEGIKPLNGYSPDRSCPNIHSSLYSNRSGLGECVNQRWNIIDSEPQSSSFNQIDNPYEQSDGLQFYHYPFPIFLLRNKTQIDLLKWKIASFNRAYYPKLSLQLSSSMIGAKDSLTCLRRTLMMMNSLVSDVFCDPLKGYNIFHHTIDLKTVKKIEKNSIVMLIVRHDSFSMFEGISPGADSAISSLVVLLAVAHLLNHELVKPKLNHLKKKELMFAIFDGEAWDYIGSSDTVHRIIEGTFPLSNPVIIADNDIKRKLSLEHISHVIELNQLLPSSEINRLYLHKNLHTTGLLRDLIKLIQQESVGISDNLEILTVPEEQPLPPSSAHSFLKRRSDYDFAVLVATNHEKEYTNKFYNSFYESIPHNGDLNELSRDLTNLATLFGRVLYRLLTEESLIPTIHANETIVGGLLKCYLHDSNCPLFRAVLDPERAFQLAHSEPMPPYPTYISAFPASKILREFTRALLFWFTGERSTEIMNRTECDAKNGQNDQQESFQWIAGEHYNGECIHSSAYKIATTSPAINHSTMEIIPENIHLYPIWTESRWSEVSVRMFVVPSLTYEICVVLLGIFIVSWSFIIVVFLDRYSNELFDDNPLNRCKQTNNIDGQPPSQVELVTSSPPGIVITAH